MPIGVCALAINHLPIEQMPTSGNLQPPRGRHAVIRKEGPRRGEGLSPVHPEKVKPNRGAVIFPDMLSGGFAPITMKLPGIMYIHRKTFLLKVSKSDPKKNQPNVSSGIPRAGVLVSKSPNG